MNGDGNTAAYRILEFLTRHRGTAFTNPQLAEALTLPADSVRRVINTLRKANKVVGDEIRHRHWQIA